MPLTETTNDEEKLCAELKKSLEEHEEFNDRLNNKNQEIFDKETEYFGYLNKVTPSSTSSTFANFLQSSNNNSTNANNDGPSYNIYGNIITGFEGFVKNSIALGSGLSSGNNLQPQLLAQVDKERDNKVINVISEMSQKNGKTSFKLSAEKVIQAYLESYFHELPDLTSAEEKQILLNYYGKLKGNFGMDNGFDNGYINKNLFQILKQRQFFGNIGDGDGNIQSTGRGSRYNPASLGMPNKQDLEAFVFSKNTSDTEDALNADGCELKDEDRIFSLSNAEYKRVDDTY